MGCDNICGNNISTIKRKSRALNRRDPVRNKMVIYNYIIEKIKALSYSDYSIKESELLQITRIISRSLKLSQVQKHNRPKIHSTFPLLNSIYICENWSIREHDKCRITSAEMKCMRRMTK